MLVKRWKVIEQTQNQVSRAIQSGVLPIEVGTRRAQSGQRNESKMNLSKGDGHTQNILQERYLLSQAKGEVLKNIP